MDYTDLRDTLNQPTDPSLIRHRRQGGTDIDYLEWFTVNRILDLHCPGWSGEAVVSVAGDTVIVTYTIKIPTTEGVVSRSAVGSEKLGSGFDPVASAEQQAFKRAAARFGVGLDLYDKDSKPATTTTSKPVAVIGSRRPPGWQPSHS
ncbi:MAG: hypothetical protein OHK0012_04900 [Synechococcales cyanobacterium]